MQNKLKSSFQDFYSDSLKTINGIKFTSREIEIIAFFVCGRSAKKIASFFSISPKTVENHAHNIMLKLGCNSREGIIDFIEKSDKLHNLRRYYTAILAQTAFHKCLKDISKLKREGSSSCLITYWQEEDAIDFLACHLKTSLSLAGFNASIEARNPSQSIQEMHRENHIIYIAPKHWQNKKIEAEEISLFAKSKGRIFLLLSEEKKPIELLKKFDENSSPDNIDQKDYYFLVFEILGKIFPHLKFEEIITAFKEQCKDIDETKYKDRPFSLEGKNPNNKIEILDYNIGSILKDKKWHLFSFFTIINVFIILFALSQEKEKGEINPFQNKNQQKKNVDSVRSDLVVPIESIRLDRPELIAQINERFKDWSGIQTVALVGVGGAGKTTLARHYASSQKLPDVWEVNAETKETLNESFEHLARSLSKTEEDQKILAGILKARLSNMREEKLIQFVKERMRICPNWFLIYDNVEKFSDIQNYFPKDSSKWGQGRIILTTRNSNIENNKHVNNIIRIGELSAEQKLDLFIKILTNGDSSYFTSAQKEEAKQFLIEIPSFPLDVSVAAYYLKATHISYKKYLESMAKYHEDFSNVQEKILKEAGDYTKTRYSIITLTLKHLIDAHNEFKDLLLFISLLDSKNIPRDLLVKYKGDVIVDDFIYHLKKYSLITNKTSTSYGLEPVFSIHRNIQSIMLAHLAKTLKWGQDKILIQSIATILGNYMSHAVEEEDFIKMRILCRHAERFLSHDDLVKDATKGFLSGELGCIYCYLCYYTTAKQLLREGLSKLNKNSNKYYDKIAHFLVYLGNVYRRLGDYEKARELLEQGLVIYKKHSNFHVGIARASGYLGVVYENLGDFTKAKALLENSLTIHKQYPTKRIGLAWSLAHLGSVYRSLGDYKKAKELFEQSLIIYKTYSENYVGAAWVCGNLGNVYTKLGNYEKARNLLEESLIIYNKHFFEDHIYIAKASVHLGNFNRETGNYEKAKNLLKKGLIVVEKTYGKDHIETGSVLRDLGQTYLSEGNQEAAENFMVKALAIFHKNKHLELYQSLECLGDLYLQKFENFQKRGKFQQSQHVKIKASSYLRQALKVLKTHFPKDSPHIVRIKDKLTHIK